MTLTVAAGSATQKGGRDANQDAVLIGDDLYAVADGLGGLQDGEIASHLALETLQITFAVDHSSSGLLHACQEANRVVWKRATLQGDDPTMGTTVAAVGITSDSAVVVAHVGDSRLYHFNNGRLSTSNLNYVDDLKASPIGRSALFVRVSSSPDHQRS